eukprot:13313528-Heterocapsa_arctica.AAC.1
MALLNVVRFPMAFLPFGAREVINIAMSMARLQTVLEAAERPEPNAEGSDGSATGKAAAVLRVAGEFGYPLAPERPDAKGKGKGKRGCISGCFG